MSGTTRADGAGEAPLRARRAERIVLAGALAALVAGSVAAASGLVTRQGVLDYFRVDYRERTSALLGEGRPAAALEELERGSSIDKDRSNALNQLARLNRAAGFRSSWMAQIFRGRSVDAELRFRIGKALLAQLRRGRDRSGPAQELLDRATANAEMLIALEPESARSHYHMGMVHLLRGTETGSSGEFSKAALHLERALSIEPAYPDARRALQEARENASNGA